MSAKWAWARASCTGTSHQRCNERRQDALLCGTLGPANSIFFGAICDGAGSASHGGHGARLCTRVFARSVCASVKKTGRLLSNEELLFLLDVTRDALSHYAGDRGIPIRAFACTLVFLISDGQTTRCFQVGDGASVVRDAHSRSWVVPNWPFHGEYASTTSFVTDQPYPHTSYEEHRAPIDALVMFSDGLENLALDLRSKAAFGPFFEGMVKPLEQRQASPGLHQALSRDLAAFLGSERVSSRTDDDKTLIIARAS
jgi:hypothetical protein